MGLVSPLDTSEPLRLLEPLEPLEPAFEAARVVICNGSDGWRREGFGGEGAFFLLSSMSFKTAIEVSMEQGLVRCHHCITNCTSEAIDERSAYCICC